MDREPDHVLADAPPRLAVGVVCSMSSCSMQCVLMCYAVCPHVLCSVSSCVMQYVLMCYAVCPHVLCSVSSCVMQYVLM